MGRPKQNRLTRFCSKISKTDSCWLWTDCKFQSGYGVFRDGGKNLRAHRVMWELCYWPIPNGYIVCHRCDVRDCVNPKHLFLGTAQDNTNDKMKKGRHKSFRGSLNPRSKLSDDEVLDIKRLAASGLPLTIIAREFGVSASAVGLIKRGQTWKHI